MRVDGSKKIYDGIIRIICGDSAKTIMLTAEGTEEDSFISLNDCLSLIDYEEGVCIVIVDDALSGEIYQYGNYGPFWTTYGTTQGYA